MRRKRYSEEHIIGVLKQAEAGIAVLDLCREQGISEETYCRWQNTYGGLKVSAARC